MINYGIFVHTKVFSGISLTPIPRYSHLPYSMHLTNRSQEGIARMKSVHTPNNMSCELPLRGPCEAGP